MLGILYLIPNTLGRGDLTTISPEVLEIVVKLRKFIVENAKSTRQYLKLFNLEVPLQELEFLELDKKISLSRIDEFIRLLLAGEDLGLISEAGCPCIADPGAEIVRAAHRHSIKVVPLVGPSSILLALISSGLGGQNFHFVGYLPREETELIRAIKELEKSSAKEKKSIIFMETPYRSEKLFGKLLEVLAASTELCLARNLSLENETIVTKSIAEFKKEQIVFNKDLTIFVLKAAV